jgi:hypothetical protein
VAGTVAALEILRVFQENNVENENPLEISLDYTFKREEESQCLTF